VSEPEQLKVPSLRLGAINYPKGVKAWQKCERVYSKSYNELNQHRTHKQEVYLRGRSWRAIA
jgi:hypothetical protein